MDTATKLDIHELLSRSAYALDERDLVMLEQTFSVEAKMILRIEGVPDPVEFGGRDQIMGLMKDSMETQTDQRRHVVTNVFFAETAANQAEVVSNITITGVEAGQIRLITSGLYRDSVVRGGDGWQIAQRIIELDMPY